MNVRFHGFRLKEGSIPISDFVDSVIRQHEIEFPYFGDSRLVYMDKGDPDYYVGLILTAKGQRKFCELDSTTQNKKITVRKLKDKHRLVEFNYFLIRKATGAGVYQTYRGSCGLMAFGSLLNHLYTAELGRVREAALLKIGGALANKAQATAVRGKFKMKLDFTPIYRRDDFETILSLMKDIKTLSFDAESLGVTDGVFVRNKDIVAKDKVTFTFSRDGNLSRIRQAIVSIVKTGRYADPTVGGEDHDGTPVSIKLEENLNSFDRCDFDLIAEPQALRLNSIVSSSIVDRMRKIIEDVENREYFK